jgi:hypothetical protein
MNTTLIIAGAALAVTFMLCFAMLRAWRGWLDYKRLELASRRGARETSEEDVGVRIELAAVRERLKKLEAIASGVEL